MEKQKLQLKNIKRYFYVFIYYEQYFIFIKQKYTNLIMIYFYTVLQISIGITKGTWELITSNIFSFLGF